MPTRRLCLAHWSIGVRFKDMFVISCQASECLTQERTYKLIGVASCGAVQGQ